MSHDYVPFQVWPRTAGDGEGVTVHGLLSGRTSANQHPATAVSVDVEGIEAVEAAAAFAELLAAIPNGDVGVPQYGIVLSPIMPSAVGGAITPGVSFTAPPLAAVPAGAVAVVWDGDETNAASYNGSYISDGAGTFTFDSVAPFNVENAGLVFAASDLYTSASGPNSFPDGAVTAFAVSSSNGTDFGLSVVGGAATVRMAPFREVLVALAVVDGSDFSVFGGGSYTPGVSVTIPAAAGLPAGIRVVVHNGDDSDPNNGSYSADGQGGGVFTRDTGTEQYAATLVGNTLHVGKLLFSFMSGLYGIGTSTGTDFMLSPLSGGGGSTAWDDVTGKPDLFDTTAVDYHVHTNIDVNAPLPVDAVVPTQTAAPTNLSVVLCGQTDPTENGVYDVDGSGNMTLKSPQPAPFSLVVCGDGEIFVKSVAGAASYFTRPLTRVAGFAYVTAVLDGVADTITVDGTQGAVQGFTPVSYAQVFIGGGANAGYWKIGADPAEPWLRDNSYMHHENGTLPFSGAVYGWSGDNAYKLYAGNRTDSLVSYKLEAGAEVGRIDYLYVGSYASMLTDGTAPEGYGGVVAAGQVTVLDPLGGLWRTGTLATDPWTQLPDLASGMYHIVNGPFKNRVVWLDANWGNPEKIQEVTGDLVGQKYSEAVQVQQVMLGLPDAFPDNFNPYTGVGASPAETGLTAGLTVLVSTDTPVVNGVWMVTASGPWTYYGSPHTVLNTEQGTSQDYIGANDPVIPYDTWIGSSYSGWTPLQRTQHANRQITLSDGDTLTPGCVHIAEPVSAVDWTINMSTYGTPAPVTVIRSKWSAPGSRVLIEFGGSQPLDAQAANATVVLDEHRLQSVTFIPFGNGWTIEAVRDDSVDVTIYVSDPSVPLTTGDGKAYLPISNKLNGLTWTDVQADLATPSTSGAVTVDLTWEVPGDGPYDMLSTNLTIDQDERSSVTAATPYAWSTQHSVVKGQRIRVDVDGAGTGATGLSVTLTFSRRQWNEA